jgi:hypothetical protein
MLHVVALVAALLTAWTATAAFSGHELPYYPSYYPQEIRVAFVEADAAAPLLQRGKMQAFIGGDPWAGAPVPADLGRAESLKGYLVLTFHPASAAAQRPEARCALASQLMPALASGHDGYRFHPYPVTPYHMDYLHHADRLAALRARGHDQGDPAQPAAQEVTIGAAGPLAEALLPPAWRATGAVWDATLEEVTLAELLDGERHSLNGWLGPLWLKEGWFHAHRLLAGHLVDASAQQRVEALYRRLTHGRYADQVERLNLERQLVASLLQGCERVVVGYTVRREYYSAEYSAGVENVAYDAQAGLNSHLFVRTVKLKDFPWNGWLTLGMASRPRAAWNPLGGFSDEAGRLLWAAVGDPGFLPAPHHNLWMANRFSPNVAVMPAPPDGLAVPRDALRPEPGTGRLVAVGDGHAAQLRVTYRVLPSAFHDGTPMTPADLLYPYSLAFRWGHAGGPDAAYDPHIDAATAFMRQKLAGVKLVSVEHEPKAFGELKLVQEVPVIDVYLREVSAAFPHVAAIAPPWSPLPWHVLALMEEAVKRRLAAFSAEEAERRRVPWLDLARSPRLKDQLASLVADFEVRGYRPPALQGLTTEAEARRRWGALKSFFLQHGHFLATNGPYVLRQWAEDAVVLQVFRDLSYPLGVGSYDKYAFPPRAFIGESRPHRRGLAIAAQIEKVEKAQRSYHVVREPLTDRSLVGVYRVKPALPFVLLSGEGEVVHAGHGHYAGDGVFLVEPPRQVPPGRYTVLTALYVNDNAIEPDIKQVPFEVAP